MSHDEYLNTLRRPSLADSERISIIQLQNESDIEAKLQAQAALTPDPSSRWAEAIKEIAEHAGAGCSLQKPSLAGPSDPVEDDDSMLLDLRYFLEMVDDKHRYGSNLQVYHEEWLRSETKQNFFVWLDRGEGRQLSLLGCDRAKLDHERVRYLSKEERKNYLVQVDGDGKLRWEKNAELVTTDIEQYRDSIHGIVTDASKEPAFVFEAAECSNHDSDDEPPDEDCAHQQMTRKRTPHKRHTVSPATILNHLLRATVRPGTWIYVVDTVGRLYVGIKAGGAFQHASFLSGARILSAGSIRIKDGQLVYLSPLSGHYRPTTKSFRTFVGSLKQQGVDLSSLRVSNAYKVLLGIEYYGKTKTGLGKAGLHRKHKLGKSRSLPDIDIYADTATETVEQHWESEHTYKHRLSKLMDDLHVRRRSAHSRRARS
ncbi:hypothetical protein LTR08_005617 [Meristemomyces frigidus]|nr:hypothetical protein LTR08_005617 [Meristemomyces frigidus]